MAEITILNRREELARASAFLDRIAAERHLAPEIVADMQVALDEILTNIVTYAYADAEEHRVHVQLRVLDDALEAVIEDDGAPFDPLAIPAPDLRASLQERRVGGLGIHFVRKLMDEMTYGRIGERNRLVLRKRFTT